MVTSKPIILISHISEEAKLAAILKAHVEADFIDTVTVYVSSDTESISAGENWLTSIDVALSEACIELILCSTKLQSNEVGLTLRRGPDG
jgi:hypothetical protein